MEDPQWTQDMDLHLLHLLTEMPNTPETFPENVYQAGKLNAGDKSYYYSMQESFQKILNMELQVPSIRKRTAFFLGGLEPTSEAVIKVVQAVHACGLEGITVDDILARIAERDSQREARDAWSSTFHTSKRSASDVAAQSACTCGTSPNECPRRDHAHYVLRCSRRALRDMYMQLSV